MIKHGCYYCLTVMKPEVVNAFVRLVTLMTPWGISIVPFSSFSVLITPLPVDSSALITVFMLPLRHAVQKYRLTGGNYAKKTPKKPQTNILSKE